MNAPANIDFAARKAQRLAENRWLAGELRQVAHAMQVTGTNRPHLNLRALEIIGHLYGVETDDAANEYRNEIGAHGIDREGFPLDWQGCRDWNADREYIPLSMDLARFREGLGK